MADPQNSSEPSKSEGLSMEKRFILALILMGLVLFLTQYVYKPAGQTPKSPPPAAPQTQAVPQPQQAPPEAAAAAPAPIGQVSATKEDPPYIIDTDLYKVVLSNRGAVVRSWVLKKYRDNTGNQLDLVNASAAAKNGYPFSLVFTGQAPPSDVNRALFVARPMADGPGVDYEYSDGHIVVKKSFRFRKDSYLSDVSSSAALDGRPLRHVLAWRGGFGDRTATNHASTLHSLRFDLSQNKLIVDAVKVAKSGPVSVTGTFSFAGIEDSYFTAVALPEGSGSYEIRTFSDQVAPAPGVAETAYLGTGFGGAGENRFPIFVGPKDVNILRSVNPKLEQVVDFGWFSIIAKPLFHSLSWVSNHYVHNYGWSIVVVTVIINFLLLPLKYTSLKSTKKMQVLQPQIAAINEKYKGIGLRDPRKAEQNQEVMDLYKKHGVNPVGGCFPMLLQIPFFYAYYKVLTVAIETRGAAWLWVTDLSQPEHLPIHILPIAMIVSQFVMQKMTPATSMDPSQQKMMMFMPLVFGFMFYGLSSGLVLYWLTGNLVGIAQQWFFNRMAGPMPMVASPQPSAKKKR